MDSLSCMESKPYFMYLCTTLELFEFGDAVCVCLCMQRVCVRAVCVQSGMCGVASMIASTAAGAVG